MSIKAEFVSEKINETNGRFFAVGYIKKNGEDRRAVARKGVRRYLRGGELNYSPREKGLETVFDLSVQDYRSVPLDRVYYFKCGHVEVWL